MGERLGQVRGAAPDGEELLHQALAGGALAAQLAPQFRLPRLARIRRDRAALPPFEHLRAVRLVVVERLRDAAGEREAARGQLLGVFAEIAGKDREGVRTPCENGVDAPLHHVAGIRVGGGAPLLRVLALDGGVQPVADERVERHDVEVREDGARGVRAFEESEFAEPVAAQRMADDDAGPGERVVAAACGDVLVEPFGQVFEPMGPEELHGREGPFVPEGSREGGNCIMGGSIA